MTVLLERGLDSSGGTGFVRERLALLAKTLFLVSFGFWLFLLASLTLIGGADAFAVVSGPVALGHICASLTMAGLWLVTTRTRLSLKALGALDAVSFALAGVFLSWMTITDEGQILQVLLALLVTVMVRAILMPSRPGRTALISALVFAPTVVVCITRHHPTGLLPGFSPGYQKLHMTLNTILWAVLGTIVATIVSRVLYGLRRQVAEASELGQYLLEEKIGGGGMGEVWRARHRLLIRPAAIKVIRQQAVPGMAADPELLMRRFEREARATAALTSPHTVQLYDFGVAEDGRLYYVMELLDGLDLDTMVREEGPVPAERVVHLLRQVCAALQDAHTNGLVHRDIKPANIVVSRGGTTTYDFVKVLDFGLVKLDSPGRAGGADAVKLSTEDSWSGTPGYMAPEVVMGATETDHRVDIYALGCVAYWLLTGKLVFEGENAMQVMMQHATAEPRRPSARIGRAMPAALEDAHANGLVHRDIKPANVVVGRAGVTFDFVKVLDFGLVKLDSGR
ncbi:MAG TPA: protein kinase, partial [Gemmatimonadales bacterium]|nr:protein kinase [Gemmatimonadales bacterium]